MKGKPEVLEVLSEMLKEELGAINQYMLHAEMCENWGYKRLGNSTKKQSIGEMNHAEKLIERILFLEGTKQRWAGLPIFSLIVPGAASQPALPAQPLGSFNNLPILS